MFPPASMPYLAPVQQQLPDQYNMEHLASNMTHMTLNQYSSSPQSDQDIYQMAGSSAPRTSITDDTTPSTVGNTSRVHYPTDQMRKFSDRPDAMSEMKAKELGMHQNMQRVRGRETYRGTEHRRGQGYRKLWQAVTKVGKGQRLGENDAVPFSDMTVEDMLRIIRTLPPGSSAVKAISQGLYYLDSRALAALLKDLAKTGGSHAAFEIFDWLRSLDNTHELSALCDVYTYTTMISQCGSHHQLRIALEFVAEMRSREIPCNVHTYSALMNVCIKANEVELALDVYQQMLSEGCIPNLVTYNILVDVYARAGRWKDSVDVLNQLFSQGLEPEPRTYNTIMQACNACGQHEQAIQIFDRMVRANAVPTGASYAAAISAYCKLEQIDKAVKLFRDMTHNGCEHALTTFNTLLTACDAMANWQLALELMQQMRMEGIRQNTASYAAVIGACLQAGQYHKAHEALTAMQTSCKLDVSSHAQYLLLHQWCGRWPEALRAFDTMRSGGIRADHNAFCAVIEVLWSAGSVDACTAALAMFEEACASGAFRLGVNLANENDRVDFHVPPSSPSSALVSLARLFIELRGRLAKDGVGILKENVVLTVGVSGKEHSELVEAVTGALMASGCPFRRGEGSQQGLQFVAASPDLATWINDADITSFLAITTSVEEAGRSDRSALMSRDQTCESQCHFTFAAIKGFEQNCRIDIKRMLQGYATSRKQLVGLGASWAHRLGLPQETLHDAVLLLDRAACSGYAASQEIPFEMVLAGCVAICAQQSNPQAASILDPSTTSEVMGIWGGDNLVNAQAVVQVMVDNNTSAVSALRLMHLYLQRLGLSPVNSLEVQQMVGQSLAVVAEAAFDTQFMSISPSLLAAAVVYCCRQAKGVWPYWPTSLAALTGYFNMTSTCQPILSAIGAIVTRVDSNQSSE